MADSHGDVWWTELMTRDTKAAQAYYGEMCGWTFQTMPMPTGEYHIAMKGERMVAGMMDMTGLPGMDDTPPHWNSYFAVDDIDATCKATVAAGGVVIQEPWDMPGTGRIAMLQDPTGAIMGMMTPEAQP
jgi:predicted enzyme related to lactoylglutathione lyase